MRVQQQELLPLVLLRRQMVHQGLEQLRVLTLAHLTPEQQRQGPQANMLERTQEQHQLTTQAHHHQLQLRLR